MRLRFALITVLTIGVFQTTAAFAAQDIDLISYMRSHIAAPIDPTTIPKYDRTKQFGGWVHQDPKVLCHTTREMVLAHADDPSAPLEMSKNGCTVVGGLWHEPYTGADVKQADELQIDHVVPLKHAYMTGAYAWSGPMRCNYANFIANQFHLLAVNSHENMAKGDQDPSGYLPPNEADRCNYVHGWMMIKAIWQLNFTSAEAQAIENVLDTQQCDESFTTMDSTDLADQRAHAITPIAACANFGG